jgi:hypothetical protein
LANIAIIGAGVNIRISNKDPLAYVERYGISEKARVQQFIEGSVKTMSVDTYPSWLSKRAASLASAANRFTVELRAAGEKTASAATALAA